MKLATKRANVSAVAATDLSTILVSPSAAASSEWWLTQEQTLESGESLTSTDRQFTLRMQQDGNLVEYGSDQSAIWATSTFVPGSIARTQSDGNVVVIAPGNRPVWSTLTQGHANSTLELQNDGSLVVYAPGHLAIWSSYANKLPNGAPPKTGGTSSHLVAALGDSYSSGEGLHTDGTSYDAGTEQGLKGRREGYSNSCHRHPDAWPRLLERYSGGKYEVIPPGEDRQSSHLACSGVTTDHVRTKNQYTEPAQLQQLTNLGYVPDIITITIGGNDFDLVDVVGDCYRAPFGCPGSVTNARNKIKNTLGGNLRDTYRLIHEAAPASKILVVGYPSLVAPVKSCGSLYYPGRLNGLAVDLDEKIRMSVDEARQESRLPIEYLSTLHLLTDIASAKMTPGLSRSASEENSSNARHTHAHRARTRCATL